MPGKVETRTSTSRPAARKVIRPSWGWRFSAMSRRAMTLIRDTSMADSARGGRNTSRRCPSTRRRTTRLCSKVSIWMSEARRRSAWPNRPLIRRMTGASSSLSSRSSIRGISLIRLSRSTWSPMPSISASVAASPTSYNWPRRSSNTAGSRYSSALGWPCTRSSSCNWALSASRRSHSCQPSAAGAMATPLCRAWR